MASAAGAGAAAEVVTVNGAHDNLKRWTLLVVASGTLSDAAHQPVLTIGSPLPSIEEELECGEVSSILERTELFDLHSAQPLTRIQDDVDVIADWCSVQDDLEDDFDGVAIGSISPFPMKCLGSV